MIAGVAETFVCSIGEEKGNMDLTIEIVDLGDARAETRQSTIMGVTFDNITAWGWY
jgi:hypothetical protein